MVGSDKNLRKYGSKLWTIELQPTLTGSYSYKSSLPVERNNWWVSMYFVCPAQSRIITSSSFPSFSSKWFHLKQSIPIVSSTPPSASLFVLSAFARWVFPAKKVNKQDFLQVIQGSAIGKMEDNLTSADPLSYTSNGSRVDLGKPSKHFLRD